MKFQNLSVKRLFGRVAMGLEKPERKLVLRIIDTQNHIIEERSLDSFLCGLRLAWELADEMHRFEENRHLSSAGEAEIDACSIS